MPDTTHYDYGVTIDSEGRVLVTRSVPGAVSPARWIATCSGDTIAHQIVAALTAAEALRREELAEADRGRRAALIQHPRTPDTGERLQGAELVAWQAEQVSP